MKMKFSLKIFISLVSVITVFAVTTAPSQAAVYDLKADTVTIDIGGVLVPMWGFGLLADPDVSVPGPALGVTGPDTSLTINLTNNLPDPVSIVIPGQPAVLNPVWFTDGQGRSRVRSFTGEILPGATGSYTWTNLKPGTFIYQSGSHPAVQVQMGLYGGLKVDSAAGLAYPGVPYDAEVAIFYSEIDTALHAAVNDGSYGTPAYPSTIDYNPEYFLVNGLPYSAAVAPLPAGNINENVLLRFFNAGLKSHAPTLLNHYLTLVAEDGNPYPFTGRRYSMLLAAGKTMDALFVPTAPGTYPVYDHRHNLTTAGLPDGGMLAYLEVASPPGAPVAVDDSYTVGEDATLTVAAPGILGNDTGAVSVSPDSPVSGPGAGLLILSPDGSFSYTPGTNFNGMEVFTYKAYDGLTYESNLAYVQINVTPVNDAPVANPDTAATEAETPLVIDVLANDIDPEGDPLTIDSVTLPTNGIGTASTDGLVVYFTPSGLLGTGSFFYVVSDGLLSAFAEVTVTVTVEINEAPVAVNDFATTPRGTPVTIDLIANDYDPDGTIDPASVLIVTEPRRGGTVDNMQNGTVIYTPPRRFRGTDYFRYTVRDNRGEVSNRATVRVNVVRP